MSAIGGSIVSVTLDGRVFAVAADADSTRKLGGFENENQPNGNGTARQIKTRVLWMVDGLTIEIDDDRGDLEFLQALSDRPGYYPIAVTYASGAVYQGSGSVSGEFGASSQNATAPVALSGPGKLVKQ